MYIKSVEIGNLGSSITALTKSNWLQVHLCFVVLQDIARKSASMIKSNVVLCVFIVSKIKYIFVHYLILIISVW